MCSHYLLCSIFVLVMVCPLRKPFPTSSPFMDPSFLFKTLMFFRSIPLRDLQFVPVRAQVFNPYVAVSDITVLYISFLSSVEQISPVKDRRIVWVALYDSLFSHTHIQVCMIPNTLICAPALDADRRP